MSEPRPLRKDPDGDGSDRPRRWIVVLGIVLAAALFALVVFLHLSGAIGPGVH